MIFFPWAYYRQISGKMTEFLAVSDSKTNKKVSRAAVLSPISALSLGINSPTLYGISNTTPVQNSTKNHTIPLSLRTRLWEILCVFRCFLFGYNCVFYYNWWGYQARDTLQDSTDISSLDKVETSLEWQEYFSKFQDKTDALPCHIHLTVCLRIINPHSRTPKNSSYGNEVLPQDTRHLIQRPSCQRGSPCQIPGDNLTTRRPDHRKETQSTVVCSCLPFTRSGKKHLARHSERGKETR